MGAADSEGFYTRASDLVERSRRLSVQELDAASTVMELMRISSDHGLRLPPELSILGQALLNLDQVARELDPDFDSSVGQRLLGASRGP